MSTNAQNIESSSVSESNYTTFSGMAMLFLTLILGLAGLVIFPGAPLVGILLGGFAFFLLFGFFTLEPNQAVVVMLFGDYKGTVSESGFHWINPFCSTMKRLSLRMRNLNTDQIKVNDKRGNPIEIAAVIVWQVKDTARAAFDVDNYEGYVSIESDSALRQLASSFPYDSSDDHEMSLRTSLEEVSEALKKELQERLDKAGVLVKEARLMHLAYAPEIAAAMLRRQQAEAVLMARKVIVQGAVSMVEQALLQLSEKEVVRLDDQQKAAMVSNLLVVLCSESEAQPVISASKH